MNTDLNVDTTSQTITAQRGHLQALAFARKGGVALSALLAGIAATKEAERRGSIETMLFLETHFTEGEQSNIPEVGSKQGETGNKPYDRYTATIKTAQGDRKVPGSWFTDAVKATAWFTTYAEPRLAFLDAGQGVEVPEDILRMGAGERKAEKVKIRQAIADMRTALTKGSMLLHHVALIDAVNPERIKVKMPFRNQKNAAGEPETVVYGNTIRLIDPSKELEDDVFTVGSFLQLDPAKIGADKVKDIANLKATAARAPKKSAITATTAAFPVPTTLETLLSAFNSISTAVDNGTDQGKKLESQLLAACAKDGKVGDEVVLSVGTVALAMDNIWTVINTRYNTLMAAKAASLNTKTG